MTDSSEVDALQRQADTLRRSQARLRALLVADRVVVEELDLERVLRRIVEVAVELIGCDYGALGVIGADGLLERFLHVGVDASTVAAIGHLPEGHGLLGAVIATAAPIRLDHLGADPRSFGFPPNHPAMDAFLGVPIRVRDRVFGNLYLTNPPSGRFTDEDEELVEALARTAGAAIENARLYDESKRRQRWILALAEVSSTLLSGGEDDALSIVVERVAMLAEAERVSIVVPTEDPATLLYRVSRGVGAEHLQGRRRPAAGTLAGAAISGRRAVSADALPANRYFEGQRASGPTVAVPLSEGDRTIGALTVARPVGAPRYSEVDMEIAAEFAAQASLAIQIARARADRERVELFEDRSRIARDLHDHVIQRLFGAGLSLQALAGRVERTDARLAQQIRDQIDSIDSAIAEIRTAVFALGSRDRDDRTSLRHRVLDVVTELGDALPAAPRLRFAGPVDLLVDGPLADDVIAVVREGLANVARHARASAVSVEVTTRDDAVEVIVDDDGIGVPEQSARAGGTTNLADRAVARGGRFTLEPLVPGTRVPGTRLRWSVPLADVRPLRASP